MTITFWNWWFSIVINNVVELHIQVGWLAVVITVLYLIKQVFSLTSFHRGWKKYEREDCDCDF
mgnify:CR=1 FL=1|jgi:hypothetical protein